ncbi:hypothetical protein HY312_01315 [Candidatus Saccharibacteria bacterium]|nr:hypothetical protein [Candidatus Saccharibacteria bacterium]
MSEHLSSQHPSAGRAISVTPPITELYPAPIDTSWSNIPPSIASRIELLRNPESSRIALYFPQSWLPASGQDDYKEAYLDAWWSLLGHVDQRADFYDGDIGERNSNEPRELVVKAAHLAPRLIDAGLLHPDELAYISRETNNDVLKTSIRDVMQPTVQNNPQPTLAMLPGLLQEADTTAFRDNHTSARQKWVRETMIDTAIQNVARSIDETTFDNLKASHDSVEISVALRALARLARHGKAISTEMNWLLEQRKNDDKLVRSQAAVSLRHLFQSHIISEDILESAGIPLTKLSGLLSENLEILPGELQRIQTIAEQLSRDPEYAKTYYPIVLVGGSRLKGYGEAYSDWDTTVLARPEAQVNNQKLIELFGEDMPLVLRLANTTQGVRIAEADETDEAWSHLVYSTVWVGEAEQIAFLRRELTSAYDNPELRHVALRRLEQDSLQYRLMHKGYARHHAVRADDQYIPHDGVASESTFWDPGYRELATKLFIERVRLPKGK